MKNCPHWEQDKTEMLKYTGICRHYGKWTENCYREQTDEDFKKCETKGRQEK